jgi:hypothetical protein
MNTPTVVINTDGHDAQKSGTPISVPQLKLASKAIKGVINDLDVFTKDYPPNFNSGMVAKEAIAVFEANLQNTDINTVLFGNRSGVGYTAADKLRGLPDTLEEFEVRMQTAAKEMQHRYLVPEKGGFRDDRLDKFIQSTEAKQAIARAADDVAREVIARVRGVETIDMEVTSKRPALTR